MGSLPTSYDQYHSALNATSSVLGKQLSADDLMLTITEEFERFYDHVEKEIKQFDRVLPAWHEN